MAKQKPIASPSPRTFDDILEIAGTRGCYNIAVILGCSSVGLIGPLMILSSSFLVATPDYWCQVDELVEANWTAEQIKNFSSPSGKSCVYYNYDYSLAADLGYEAVMADPSLVPGDNTTIACSKRFFEDGVSSIVAEFDLVCENLWLSSTSVAANQIGMLIGSLTFGFVQARFGRRFGIIIAVIGFLPTSFGIAGSVNSAMYISLRTLSSTFGSAVYAGGFVLAMEFCIKSQRSLVSCYFALPWALGYMGTAVIAYFVRDWRYLQVALTLPAILPLINFIIVPESPRWLCQRGRYNDALQIVKKIASSSRRELPSEQKLLSDLEKVIPQKVGGSLNSKISYKGWVTTWIVPQLQWKTCIVFFIWFSVAMVYFGVSLGASAFGLNEYLYIFIGGVLELVSYLVIWPGVAFLGRRNCTVITLLVGAVALLGVMAMQILDIEDTELWISLFSYSGKFMVTATFQIIHIITGELFPTSLRSVMLNEATVCGRFGSILAPFINTFLGRSQDWAPAAFFGAFSLAAGFLAMLLPETKDKSLDDEDHMGEKLVTSNEARTTDSGAYFNSEGGNTTLRF